MHRSILLDLLDRYNPVDVQEITSKKTMIEFVQRYPTCFERSLLVGHVTASTWLVDKKNSQVLLTLHAKFNDWLQLGGHCDGDSDVIRVAIKEAQEESGIMAITPVISEIFDVDVHPVPARGHEPEHYHYDVRFLMQVTSDECIQQSVESKDLRWFPRDVAQLPTQHPSILRMFNKWLTYSI